MKSVIVLSFASVVGLLMVCDPASAHHGNSSYDDKNPIALKGTVTQFIWSNPHSLLFFDVKRFLQEGSRGLDGRRTH
jgi:hypothetical protein